MTAYPLPLIEQREIEARILAPFFTAVAVEIGPERAREHLSRVIRDLALESGRAATEIHAGNGLAELKQVVAGWQANGALELEVILDDAESFNFNVTRCCFAEMYERLGLRELGPILSCSRDGAMIEGFNPKISFSRDRTIMQGASHCNFRYRLANPESIADVDARNSATREATSSPCSAQSPIDTPR